MTGDEIYEIWRPSASPWSPWVKPVLFSLLREQDLATANYSVPPWRVPLELDTAIVADVPGAEGVSIGIALCRDGYIPIPVYNACPFATPIPDFVSIVHSGTDTPVPERVAVDVLPIMSALCGTAQELATANISGSAPPVFMLDSNRRGLIAHPDPGWFDNRSFVTVTDFPSAQFFRQHGISKIVLVQESSKVDGNLKEVLLAWQKEGMAIAQQEPWELWAPRPVKIEGSSIFSRAWEWLNRAFGYRRNALGGFGGVVPPSGG